MKTIIHLTHTDEQRALFNNALCKKGLASRKDVTAWVMEAVDRLITTQEHNNDRGEEAELAPGTAPERTAEVRPAPGRDRGVREFVPSRGDEDYLAQPKDAGIAAACSRILDDTALIEAFAWDTVERNRKK